MSKRNVFLSEMKGYVRNKYPDNIANSIMNQAESRFEELLKENADETAAQRQHTVQYIYPAIALFESAIEHLGSRDEATKLIYDGCVTCCQKPAKTLRTILKVPGLHRIMPSLLVSMTNKIFGTEAGFKYKFHECNKKEMAVDIIGCPYIQSAKKYDCAEIVPAFCEIDDICYRNMHPKLRWGRTKTLGRGDDCCNFRLSLVTKVK